MLPRVLSGSYRRYKEDTDVFTTWLSEAAKACGYKPVARPQNTTAAASSSSTPAAATKNGAPKKSVRLKGKERKLAKEAVKQQNSNTAVAQADEVAIVKYTVSTQDILDQATAVANWAKGKMYMPLKVQRVLCRAIQARQRCAAWFEKTDIRSDQSREGHQYFIDVLRKVYGMLKSPNNSTGDANGSTTLDDPSVERKTDMDFMQNRFAALDVEDTDESLDIIASDISTMAAPTKDTSKNQSPAVYEVEVDYKWDFQFAIYCFFEDLHNLQEYLQGTWKRYKAGDIDIISATILTTGALDQVHRAEKEIYAMYPSPLPQGRAYEDLAIIMRCMESICNGKNPLEPFASREFTPFEEYIYLPTANCLMKFAEFHEQVFPSMVPPIGLRYILQPELLESPHMRKLEAEDRVLTQILIDLDLIELMKDDHSEILKTTMPGIDERILPVESVFASRLLLDILDICGGHFKGREILLDEASCTQSIFQFKKKTRVFAGEGYQWFSGDENLFMKVCQLLNVHIGSPIEAISKKSMFRHFREAFESRESGSEELDPVLLEAYPERPPQNLIENAKKFNIRIIRPNKDLHFRTNHNPLYVGSLLFNLTALTEDAGVAFANQQLFIFEIAHLYNAVRQLDLSGIRWPKMERIIDMHVRAFFAGEVPVTPDAMLKRLNFRMGQSCERTFFKKKAWKIQPSPATQALNQLFEKKEVADLTLQQLKEHVQKRHNQCSQRKPKQSRQHPLTPREFIDQLETYLGVVLPDIRTDYVTLTRACNIVLRCVRLRLELQLGVKVPSMQIPGVANDLGLMDMVLWILEETSEEWELHRRVTRDRDREPFRGGPMLRVVAEVIDEFLEANCEELG